MSVAKPPQLEFGETFEVKSQRGRDYTLTFIAEGKDESGLFVRTEDGTVARLMSGALDWDSFSVQAAGPPAIRRGDRLMVESESGFLQGDFRGIEDGNLSVDLPIGVPLAVPQEEISACYLAFRARDLKPGDHLYVHSNSGNVYRGRLRSVGPGDTVRVHLVSGSKTNLRLKKIDLSTLVVLISIPLEELFRSDAT